MCLCNNLKPIDGCGDVVGEWVGVPGSVTVVPDSSVAGMPVDAAGCGAGDEAEDGELKGQIDN